MRRMWDAAEKETQILVYIKITENKLLFNYRVKVIF